MDKTGRSDTGFFLVMLTGLALVFGVCVWGIGYNEARSPASVTNRTKTLARIEAKLDRLLEGCR